MCVCVVSVYPLALVKQVVILVDVEGGHGGRCAGVHSDGEVKIVRTAESCERGQGLQSHDCVLREETRSRVTRCKSSVTVQSLMDLSFDIHG